MCHVPSVVNDLSSQIYAPLNGCVTKAIASFYEMIQRQFLLVFLRRIYIPILYLPTFSESNARDFHLVMTEISRNVPASSKDFRRISEDFRSLPKIKCPLTVPEDVWALSKLLKTTLLACFDIWFRLNRKKDSKSSCVKNNLSGFVNQAWEIVLDAWDRCL